MGHCEQRFVTRRAALASAALLGASGLAPWQARAADDKRAIGLGFSLYGMKTLAVPDALAACARIGYDCVELPVMADWPANSGRLDQAARRQIREQLAENHLRLSALMENLPLLPADEGRSRRNVERLKLAVALARDLAPSITDTDARHVPLVETILGGKPGEFDKVKDDLVRQLGQWAEVAEEARVVVAVKAHIGNAVQRPEQLVWLLEAVNSPWLKAAYDYSHFQLQDLDMAKTMDALLSHSAFIHVKDTHRADGKWRFLLPGEGAIDYVAFARHLKQSPYHGDVVVEVSGQVFSQPGYDPLAAAQQCYEHLARAFAEAGVRNVN